MPRHLTCKRASTNVKRPRVMCLRGTRKQIKTIAMPDEHFANASNQMTIRRKRTTGKWPSSSRTMA